MPAGGLGDADAGVLTLSLVCAWEAVIAAAAVVVVAVTIVATCPRLILILRLCVITSLLIHCRHYLTLWQRQASPQKLSDTCRSDTNCLKLRYARRLQMDWDCP